MGRKKYNTEEERKEAKKAANRRWREAHPDYGTKWRKTHPDYNAAIQAEYRANHKEEKAAYDAEYRAEYRSTPFGRAAYLVGGYRLKDKKYNRGDCTIDAQWIVDNVFSGQVCHYCGETDWKLLGVDRINNSLPHTPENCVPCCWECNLKKQKTPYDEFMRMIGKIKSGGSPTS